MKRFAKITCIIAAAFMMMALAGCSDGSSGSDDETETSGGNSSSSTSGGSSGTSGDGETSVPDVLESDHVRVENVSGGVLFTITRPTEDAYSDGFGSILIYRIKDGVTSIRTHLNVENFTSGSKTYLYPLCEAGEQYTFNVSIEPPKDVDNYRNYIHGGEVTITATGGIGEYFDASDINDATVELTYADDTATVKVTGYKPPKLQNVKPRIQFFAGNGKWDTSEDSEWIADWNGEAVTDFDSGDSTYNVTEAYDYNSEQNKTIAYLASQANVTDKNKIFCQFAYTFEVPNSQDIDTWATEPAVESEIVTIE